MDVRGDVVREMVEEEKTENEKKFGKEKSPCSEEEVSIQLTIVITPKKYRLLQKHAEQRSFGVSSLVREIIDNHLLRTNEI